MNIGIFTNAYKPIISGVVNSVDLFSSGLRRQGCNVYIFAPQFFGYKDTETDIFRYHSINLSTKVKFPLAIPISGRIWKVLHNLNLDIIHTHHPFILGEVGAYFAKKFNLPLFFTFHTQYEQYSHYIPFNQELVKKLARVSVVNYAQKCDTILTPSEMILGVLKNYGIKKPVILFSNAIDTEKFRVMNRKKARKLLNLNPADKILIYTGRIGLEKNLAFLVQAFKRVNEEEPNTKLLLVGDGPEEAALKKLVKELKLKEKVIFAGKVEYSEIPKYYIASDIFVMTSVTEVKPLAILEGMAAGLPVVAVSAAGAKDTVTHGVDGILTNLDLDEYTQELLKVVKNSELCEKMGEAALLTSEKYSIDKASQKLLSLYETAILEKNNATAILAKNNEAAILAKKKK